MNRDREQLREAMAQLVARVDRLLGSSVSRDDLRQYWVEMAARIAKQQDTLVTERAQLRHELADRIDQLASTREYPPSADTRPLQAAIASQKAATDELRRELQQLGARLLAAAPRGAVDGHAIDAIRASMADAAAAFSRAATKDDVESLRTQLAGTVTRLERSFQRRLEEEEYVWSQRLAAALEGVRLAVEGAEVSRQAMLGQASSAIRAALGAVIPPFPNS